MGNYIIVVGLIPAVIHLLLAVSLFEKPKSNVVHESKLLCLYIPIIADFILCTGATFNLWSYIDEGCKDKSDLLFVILFYTFAVLSIIVFVEYKRSYIKYDDEKLFYRGKWYYYKDIESFGSNKNDNVFVFKDGKKVKFSILSVGAVELSRTYNEFKKTHLK